MGEIYNNQLDRIGRVDSDGYIYDNSLNRVGRIRNDAVIVDNMFNRVGHIDKDGYIYNAAWDRMGRVDKDGYVFDNSLNRIGRVDESILKIIFRNDGNIIESKPASVGYNQRYSMQDNPLMGSGVFLVIGILLIISIAVLCVSGGELLQEIFTSPIMWVFLAVSVIVGFISLFFEEQIYLKIYLANYIISLILWSISMIGAEWIDDGAIEIFILTIISICIGSIIMLLFAGLMLAVSVLIRETMAFLHRKHKLKFVIPILILLVFVMIWKHEEILERIMYDHQEDVMIDNDYHYEAENLEIEETEELIMDTESGDLGSNDEYILFDSNARYLDREDIDHLNASDLRLARNEIYARHGRKFNDVSLQEYFDEKDWYIGTISPSDFTDSMLNEYEFYNVNFISDYEMEMGY